MLKKKAKDLGPGDYLYFINAEDLFCISRVTKVKRDVKGKIVMIVWDGKEYCFPTNTYGFCNESDSYFIPCNAIYGYDENKDVKVYLNKEDVLSIIEEKLRQSKDKFKKLDDIYQF